MPGSIDEYVFCPRLGHLVPPAYCAACEDKDCPARKDAEKK